MTILELSLSGFLLAIFTMTASWGIAVRWNFFSLVDVSWAYGIGLIAIFYALAGHGETERRAFAGAAVALWSLRLGSYLLFRLKRKFPEEDRRYQKIRATWRGKIKSNFFWFFQFQAVTQAILTIPILLAVQNSKPVGWIDGVAVILAIFGIVGETLADNQMKNFRKIETNQDKVCDIGLWKFSRHPNYFFEWVIWCGFSLFGIQANYGYLSLVSPVIMFLLLNYVTGVPPAEEQSLLSKGDLFRLYQKRTSKFFPWLPKK